MKFDDTAHRVMGLARQEAQRLNCAFIDTEHILLGIVQEGSGADVLMSLNVDIKRIRCEIEKVMEPPPEPTVWFGQLPFGPGALQFILKERNVALVGCKGVGKSSLVRALFKERARSLAFGTVDYAIFDQRARPRGKKPCDVWLFPEGELFIGARTETLATVNRPAS